MLGNEIVSALIDTGSTVSLIREDVSTKIVDHSRLSKINTVLYGLGQTEVITKGSFERENDCDAERDRRERRDSGFIGEKPRFSVNVEANRLSGN
ncbi:hypothetical protein TNCV_1025291 [Trichonephila clavipes]|nr:hypothetical protein TNCV_1025291 [Trichonephila clavipes]